MAALRATPHRLAVIASSDINTKRQSVKNYQKLKKIKDMRKIVIIGIVAIAATACNVTRTITTRSEAWQKGDTSVVIQTKTVETYDASKKGL